MKNLGLLPVDAIFAFLGYAFVSVAMTGGDLIGVTMMGDGFGPTVVVGAALIGGLLAVAAWRAVYATRDRWMQ